MSKIAPDTPEEQCSGNGAGSQVHSNGYKSGERGKVDYLAEHRGKVQNRFTPAKRRARAMARYIRLKAAESPEGSIDRERFEKLNKDVAMCRNHLLFKNHFQEQRVTLSRMKSCKRTKLCPLCAVAHANAHVVTYHAKTLQLIREHREQGVELRAYFVTLTVKNGVSLPETYEHFSKSVQNLVNRRRAAEKARAGSLKHQYALGSVMASVVAGVFSFEVKRGSGSGLWHPHTHGLLLSTEDIDARALSAEWKAITGDSFIVDCRQIDGTDVKSLAEVLKYSMKFSEMSLEDNFNAAMALQQKRLLRSFGEFYDLKPDSNTDIDDTTVLNSPFIEQLYAYGKGSYHLIADDGAVKVPERVVRDITPMLFRRYSVDFVPGTLISCGFPVTCHNGHEHELSTNILSPVDEYSTNIQEPVIACSPTIQRGFT